MIKLILTIVVVIAVLSYFGVSVRGIVESEIFQDNFSYAKDVAMVVWDWAVSIWDKYLVGPASYLWNDIFMDLLWDSFVDNMQKIKGGANHDIIDSAPSVIEMP